MAGIRRSAGSVRLAAIAIALAALCLSPPVAAGAGSSQRAKATDRSNSRVLPKGKAAARPGVRSTTRAGRSVQQTRRNRSRLEERIRRAETDRSVLDLLPKWYATTHLRPWTASMPIDPGKHYYRGVVLTVPELLEVLDKGFQLRRSRYDRIYFTSDPATAAGYALPGPGHPLRDSRFVVAIFQVDASSAPELDRSTSYRTSRIGKGVPASAFTGVWVLDPGAKDGPAFQRL